jgi:hypothetical protein
MGMKLSPQNRIRFTSEAEVQAAGYRLAKNCPYRSLRGDLEQGKLEVGDMLEMTRDVGTG